MKPGDLKEKMTDIILGHVTIAKSLYTVISQGRMAMCAFGLGGRRLHVEEPTDVSRTHFRVVPVKVIKDTGQGMDKDLILFSACLISLARREERSVAFLKWGTRAGEMGKRFKGLGSTLQVD